MEAKHRKTAQEKYRKTQNHKGLVRFELQVKTQSKMAFDALVEAAAQEYEKPWDPRRRMALARVKVFEEITQGISHEFSDLQRQIRALKDEVAALSPAFFKSDSLKTTPLPEAIRALPDNPTQLKALLARTYREAQKAKLSVKQHKRQAKQYSELYEVTTTYNDELKKRLKEAGIAITD